MAQKPPRNKRSLDHDRRKPDPKPESPAEAQDALGEGDPGDPGVAEHGPRDRPGTDH